VEQVFLGGEETHASGRAPGYKVQMQNADVDVDVDADGDADVDAASIITIYSIYLPLLVSPCTPICIIIHV
jgi:hypothetical protein